MAEQLVVIGASTPTIIRVVDDINLAGARRMQIVGFLDNAYAALGKEFYGNEILGAFEAIRKFEPDSVALINTIIGTIGSRVETTKYFLSLGYRFTNVVHPGVNTKYVTMGSGKSRL